MTDKRTESQFDEHNCPGCPDTSSYDAVIKGPNTMFHGWAKAAKEHAIAAHKFDLAAKDWMKNR